MADRKISFKKQICNSLSFCFKYLNIVVFILVMMVVVILLSRSDFCSKLNNTLYRQQVRNPKCALCLFLDTALYGLYDVYCVYCTYLPLEKDRNQYHHNYITAFVVSIHTYMHVFMYFFFIIL